MVPQRPEIPDGWIDTRKELPPRWVVVDTISQEGIRQPLQLCPPLWFNEANTHWTHPPLCWRPRE